MWGNGLLLQPPHIPIPFFRSFFISGLNNKVSLTILGEPLGYAKIIYILFATSILLAACSGGSSTQEAGNTAGQAVSVPGGEYRNITVPELQVMMENKDFVFVNVHIPFEGDIPNTDLSIPFDEVERHMNKLPSEKDAKIVLYCRSGRMSSIAAEELVRLGYNNVWNLEGGFNAWKQAGLPLEGE